MAISGAAMDEICACPLCKAEALYVKERSPRAGNARQMLITYTTMRCNELALIYFRRTLSKNIYSDLYSSINLNFCAIVYSPVCTQFESKLDHRLLNLNTHRKKHNVIKVGPRAI